MSAADPIAQASVELSDLLDSPDPADREKLRDWCQPTRPGEADQIKSACDQVALISQLTAVLNPRTTYREGARTEYPSWVRLQLAEVALRFSARRGRTCPHADPDRAEPWFACAWAPDLVTCSQCLHLAEPSAGSVLSRTCDQCGYVCPGPPDDGIRTIYLSEGPLIFALGVCRTCWLDMPGGQDEPFAGSPPHRARQPRRGARKRRKR
jgi:hypothetical protein